MAANHFEDVTVTWGQPRSQADIAFERWWHAIYQDMVPSFDGSKYVCLISTHPCINGSLIFYNALFQVILFV